MLAVEQFFAQHGKVLSTRLRKNKERKFKGSVFVEFGSEEEAKKVKNRLLASPLLPSPVFSPSSAQTYMSSTGRRPEAQARRYRPRHPHAVRAALLSLPSDLTI